jgi:hypothetical protein
VLEVFNCSFFFTQTTVRENTEGVVRWPSLFATMVGCPPSIAATAEFVVPVHKDHGVKQANTVLKP